MPGQLRKGPRLRRLWGLAINLNTARALDLTVPLIMQVTVDEMIEASLASTLTLLHLLTAGFGQSRHCLSAN